MSNLSDEEAAIDIGADEDTDWDCDSDKML